MLNPVSKAITKFMRARCADHPGADLVDRYLKFGTALETQVNIIKSDGEPVAGKPSILTNGTWEWWPIRVPKNADSDPVWKDYKLTWPLELYAEGIGSTGWQWGERRSRWVGFDFDALTNHAKGVGVSKDELEAVRKAAEGLPYIEARKSTGGQGVHLYVIFDEAGIPTANHTEHAALARCILGMMASDTNFDFARAIDCCGGNMWLWHRKLAASEGEGLKLIKPAETTLSKSDLPGNWKDHVEVIAGRRTKIRVCGVDTSDEDPFEKLTSAFPREPLDDGHKALIDELAGSGFSTVWVPDHHLLQTHTAALRELVENDEKQTELGLIGFFKTDSPGTDRANPNCFMFPLPKSAWKVYRFSPGVVEEETWTQDGEGWTTCYFNRVPDLDVACKAIGAAELTDNKGYLFETAADASRAADALGAKVKVAEKWQARETKLRKNKDGRLVVSIKQEQNEAKPGSGWIAGRGGWWERVFSAQTAPASEELGFTSLDQVVRVLITPERTPAGYMIHSDQKTWDWQTATNVKMYLQSEGYAKTKAEAIMGAAVGKRWMKVSIPFQPEYLGGRRWNLDAPQLKFTPAQLEADEVPHHPHWDLIFQHIGADLDDAVKEMSWCQRHGVQTGAQWLLLWVACMFRDPFEHLPYLFLHGPEDSGKSIFHESIDLLVTKGVVQANRALTNSNRFNGELEGAILAYVEELNLSKEPDARNRMKELVTARRLTVRRMRTDAYDVPNTLHFVQCANLAGYCPVWPGDSRITVIHVPVPAKPIKKRVLLNCLEDEAPHFLATIMSLELPPGDTRLRIPIIETEQKAALANESCPLNEFVHASGCCVVRPDAKAGRSALRIAFNEWAEDRGHTTLSQREFWPLLREITGGVVKRKGKVKKGKKEVDAYRGIGLVTQSTDVPPANIAVDPMLVGVSTAPKTKLDCRVLLAEDDLDNQRRISLLLKKAGADVTVAENGQVAHGLALAARDEGTPFDVILMDMQMPVMDGYDATAKLRDAGRTTPIIALATHAMSTDRDKCLKAGCDDFTTKPIDDKKLISLVAKYASRPSPAVVQ